MVEHKQKIFPYVKIACHSSFQKSLDEYPVIQRTNAFVMFFFLLVFNVS